MIIFIKYAQSLLPLLPPPLLVLSVGMGVTSSILPIFIPKRAKALKAAWAPGPGVLDPVPPLALSLICKALIFKALHLVTTSWAAIIANIKFFTSIRRGFFSISFDFHTTSLGQLVE